MHFTSIPNLEKSFIQQLTSAGKLTPFTYGTAPEQVEGLFYTSPNTHFFFEEIVPKKRIVLHFTAGHLKGDLNQLSQQDYHVSVPFVIGRNGTIFQLFSSKHWSHHLGMSSNNPGKIYDKESIAIEISNYGWLNKVGSNLETAYSRALNNVTGKKNPIDIYADLSETEAYKEINPPYREKKFYAAYTDAQLKSLIRLVRWLCQKYQIPKAVLPPELRFESTKAARDFAGIVSHVNYRTDGKWDIGPAFDWDGFVSGLNAPVPSATRGATMKSKPGLTEEAFTKNKNKGDKYESSKRTVMRAYDPGNWE